MKAKKILADPVGDAVASGDAEIGFQQISELLPVKGIVLLGPLPPQRRSSRSSPPAWRPTPSSRGGPGIDQVLASPAAAKVITKTGMEPVSKVESNIQKGAFHFAGAD